MRFYQATNTTIDFAGTSQVRNRVAGSEIVHRIPEIDMRDPLARLSLSLSAKSLGTFTREPGPSPEMGAKRLAEIVCQQFGQCSGWHAGSQSPGTVSVATG